MSWHPQPFVTSVRVDLKPGAPHAYVTVWIHGANCGTLCVREEEAAPLKALLMGPRAIAADRHDTMLPPAPSEDEWKEQE